MVVIFQFRKAFPQALCIELGDLEWSIAALRTSGFADEPGPASARGLCQSSVDDLDKVGVGRHA